MRISQSLPSLDRIFIDEFVQRIDVITQQLFFVDGASVLLLQTVPTDLHPLRAQPTRLEGRSA